MMTLEEAIKHAEEKATPVLNAGWNINSLLCGSESLKHSSLLQRPAHALYVGRNFLVRMKQDGMMFMLMETIEQVFVTIAGTH